MAKKVRTDTPDARHHLTPLHDQKIFVEKARKAAIRKPMKKLILSILFVGFAVAVQAGDAKTCTGKDKAACCSTTKVSDAGCCSSAKGTTCKAAPVKMALLTPKGAEQARR